jgi:hypothetical protein
VEEFGSVWVCCGWPTPPTAHSHRFQLIAADSSNGVKNTRCCRYSCMRSWLWVEVPPETCRAVYRYKLCNVVSCWIYNYIGILLGAHPILHISRIRVNLVTKSKYFGQTYSPSIGPAIGICHTSYVDCLLARSGWNCCEYSIKTPDDGQ